MRYLLIALLFLTACGDPLETKDEKPLFSKWVSGDSELDLSGLGFSPSAVSIKLAPNSGCNCTIELIGTELSGEARISACTHYGPTDYCWAGTNIYDYTNSFGYLYVCLRGGNCEVYQ